MYKNESNCICGFERKAWVSSKKKTTNTVLENTQDFI